MPYTIHTVLTDNGTHFTDPQGGGWTVAEIKEMLARKEIFRCHSFDLACAQLDIEHRLTRPNHPWTNGQVERMNRTLKEATVRRFYYANHDQLREHLQTFVAAYKYAKRLKALSGLTPYEYIVKCWTDEPHLFKVNPHHHTPGPNTPFFPERSGSSEKYSKFLPPVGKRWILMPGASNTSEPSEIDSHAMAAPTRLTSVSSHVDARAVATGKTVAGSELLLLAPVGPSFMRSALEPMLSIGAIANAPDPDRSNTLSAGDMRAMRSRSRDLADTTAPVSRSI